MPGNSVIAKDLKVISNETYLLSVDEIEVSVDFFKLLSREIKIDKIFLKKPTAYIVRNESGIFNFEKLYAALMPPQQDKQAKADLNLEEMIITEGQLLYFDKKPGRYT